MFSDRLARLVRHASKASLFATEGGIMRTEGILKTSSALAAGLALLMGAGAASAQVPITALDVPVVQDFDTLSKTGGTSTAVPTGWIFSEVGDDADDTYGVDTGGATAGNTYSYGTFNAADRAFGSLASGRLEATLGASFVNNTGGPVVAFTIAYFGEWWRAGNAASDPLVFEYSTNATSLTTGTWTAVGALAFGKQDAPCQTSASCGNSGAKDGNQAGLRARRSAVISGLSIASGARLWIRWRDTNAQGNDDGLAVDDFSLTAHATAPAAPPEVSLLKEVAVVGGGSVLPGTVLEYNVLVEVAADSAQGVADLVVSDVLPAQVSALAAADPSFEFVLDLDTVVLDLTAAADGDEGEIVGDVVTVRVGDLAAGDLALLTFRAKVDPSNVAASIVNVATGTFDGASSGTGFEVDSNEAAIAMVACSGAAQCNDGNPCTDDACSAQGACTHTNNTATCDDGNACTPNDACAGGACVGSGTLACNDTNPCTDDACNPASGCTFTNNTAPCSDGSACTQADTCAGGACVGGAALDCDDGEVCTTDNCDAVAGCQHADNTLACDDGSAATHTDTCAAGACAGTPVVCDPGNQCQVAGTPDGTASCPPADKPNTAPCDDGDAATHTDLCDGAGHCVGTPIGECPADTACGSYAPDGAECVFTPKSGPCDDGRADTRNDACQAGACVGVAYACTPSQCEASAIPNGIDCTITFKATGTACDDGRTSTRDDACDGAGTCVGVAFTCIAGPCELSSVPDGERCLVTPAAAGAVCDDGDPCTSGDLCDGAGGCGGAALCGAGELCDGTGGCDATHCLACEDDAECGVDSACLEVDGAARCLLACESDADCADGQVCHAYGSGGQRCFDETGPCAVPTTDPDENPEVVEPGPEEAEPNPEAIEPGPEPTEVPPEASPETTPEPGAESVEPTPDASDASGDVSGAESGGTVERENVEGGGCAGGLAGGELAGLMALAGLAFARRRTRA